MKNTEIRCVLKGHILWTTMAVIVGALACSTIGSGTQPGDGTQPGSVTQPSRDTEPSRGTRQREHHSRKKTVAKVKNETLYYDLTRTDNKQGADSEKEKIRRQLYEQFSVDSLLRCAEDNAIACPSPVTVRLQVDTDGAVQGVSLKSSKPENEVWVKCLEETYKSVKFDPQKMPAVIKTRFQIDCGKS